MNTPELLKKLADVIDSARADMTWDDIYAATVLLERHIKIHWETATKDQIDRAILEQQELELNDD